MNRLIAYIDGFNLYFGLKEMNWRRYYWLNIQRLVENLLKPNQLLVETKYFTARITGPPDKARRQSTFLEALGTLPNCQIYYGKYLDNIRTCKNCGHQYLDSKEKMTDINIAVEMIADAYNNKCDVQMLISADSDLTPVLKLIKKTYRSKRIIVALPPARYSVDLTSAADASFRIFRKTLANSVFPDSVVRADGFILARPAEWH